MSEVIASPSVRVAAMRMGLDLDQLARSLGRTTIAHEDLGRSQTGQPQEGHAFWEVDHGAYGPITTEPVSRFSQVAAQNLAAAQALIPAVTHHDRADMTAIDTFRAAIRHKAEARGIKLTALAFHIKALAQMLGAYPKFNSSLSGDGKTLVLKHYVHIGIAVDTAHGLMVPVLRNVDRLGIWDIAVAISDLSARARNRKIRPDETGGACMSITNLGGIGGSGFSPIVNPPEVAILGLSRTQTETAWHGEKPSPRPMLPLDLSYDHRVINGAEAARFLADFAQTLSDPRRMLV